MLAQVRTQRLIESSGADFDLNARRRRSSAADGIEDPVVTSNYLELVKRRACTGRLLIGKVNGRDNALG